MAARRKPKWDFGKQFSNVHGMIVRPKKTIKEIIHEPLPYVRFTVPAAVVFIAGILTSLGIYVWPILFDQSIINSIFKSVVFTFDLFLRPFFFIIYWWALSFILHFIAKLVKGADLTDRPTSQRMIKLTGYSFAPYLLNIIPLFHFFTGLWVLVLLMWSVQANYKLSEKLAFLTVFPVFVLWVIKTAIKFGLL